jgi:hypothetical protein
MAKSDKIHEHTLRRFFFDILRDNNSSRYSITKFAALVGLILLTATVIMGLILMWKTKVVDHVFFLELLGFILTLLGFKNNFGIRASAPPVVAPVVQSEQQPVIPTDDQGQKDKCIDKYEEGQPDAVDDKLTN